MYQFKSCCRAAKGFIQGVDSFILLIATGDQEAIDNGKKLKEVLFLEQLRFFWFPEDQE